MRRIGAFNGATGRPEAKPKAPSPALSIFTPFPLMSQIKPIPSIMVLTEEAGDHLVFSYRKGIWAAGMLIFMLVFSFMALFPVYMNRHDHSGDAARWWIVGAICFFDALLLWSSLFSLNSQQWLRIDGAQRRAKFYWKSFYGLVEWEVDGAQLKEIKVFRNSTGDGQAMNWTIMLTHPDGTDLFMGENEFGSLKHERALALGGRVAGMLGIAVKNMV
ncbi:MAG: hypothetical protein HQL17_00570 [Candidatus Omnitrophica bacterium]|nr:hypothetical protein [Candidatus Omnitrophota bacterium]